MIWKSLPLTVEVLNLLRWVYLANDLEIWIDGKSEFNVTLRINVSGFACKTISNLFLWESP